MESRHQNGKLTEWKAKCEPLQRWLTAKAIEAKSLKEIATDIFTVQRYLGETKVTAEDLFNNFEEALTDLRFKACSMWHPVNLVSFRNS